MSHVEGPSSRLLGTLDTYTAGVTFAAAAAIYYLGKTIYDVYFGPLSKFPGPKINAWSRIPSILTLVRGDDNVDIPRLHQQYGPIVRITPDSLSMADGAESFKQVYGFRKAGQPKPVKDTKFYGKPLNGVHSVIGADDAGHSRQRKILSNAFSDKALKEQTPLLKRWVGLMKKKLEERAVAGTETDMLKMYNCTTFDIMGDLTFGEGLNMLEDSEYSPWVKAIFGGIKNATFFRGIKLINALTSFVVEEIIFKSEVAREKQFEHWNYSKERVDRRLQTTPGRPDLWSRILEKSDGPGGLSLEEHHSNASLFMVAGTETTATALSGTTFYLLRNPDSLATLSKEIRSAFHSFDDLDLDVLARQKYLMAVLQEGLRMYPPVPTTLPRVVPEGGMIIDGKFVPEGTIIGVHHLSTYRMESHFKNASEWHPERWLGDPEYKDDHLDALEPFSVGPRNCLGKNLAWHEMRLLLATVVLHFDLKLLPQSEKWNEQHVYTLWEKKPLWCSLTPAAA
ncbi:cytochrome P450 [Hortaea werneckii]|nr:cytochrome P450 [Hortaea werneckii]